MSRTLIQETVSALRLLSAMMYASNQHHIKESEEIDMLIDKLTEKQTEVVDALNSIIDRLDMFETDVNQQSFLKEDLANVIKSLEE